MTTDEQAKDDALIQKKNFRDLTVEEFLNSYISDKTNYERNITKFLEDAATTTSIKSSRTHDMIRANMTQRRFEMDSVKMNLGIISSSGIDEIDIIRAKINIYLQLSNILLGISGKEGYEPLKKLIEENYTIFTKKTINDIIKLYASTNIIGRSRLTTYDIITKYEMIDRYVEFMIAEFSKALSLE